MNILNPFIQCSDSLDNRQRLRAVLLDFFPGEKVKANVLLIAYDSGIMFAIESSQKLDNAFALRLEKKLCTDYAITSDMARWAVEYWMEKYGAEVLKKDISFFNGHFSVQSVASKTKSVVQTHTSQRPIIADRKNTIDKIEKGTKLSKNCIIIDEHSFARLGIDTIKCSIRKGYTFAHDSHLDVNGEYEGKATKEILLYFMCFNENSELIAAEFNVTISSDFKGKETYSTIISVPNWEKIDRVEVKATLNPVML